MLLKENNLKTFIKEDKEEDKDDIECRYHSRPHSTFVRKHTTTYRIYQALENAFIINTSRKHFLKRKMNSISMYKGETINSSL